MSLLTGPPAFTVYDLPTLARAHRVSVESYHKMGEHGLIAEKTELIRGVIVDKMPISPLHAYLVERLARMLYESLDPQWSARSQQPLTLRDSEPEPDLAVVRGAASLYVERHPTIAELVIEVAISSEEVDRLKASLYAEAEIGEYWIVLGNRKAVEVYSEPIDGRYTRLHTVTSPDGLSLASISGVYLSLEELFGPTP